jgi:hypothetical protein
MKLDILMFPLILFFFIFCWGGILLILSGIALGIIDFFKPSIPSDYEKPHGNERRILIIPLIIVSLAYWGGILYVSFYA